MKNKSKKFLSQNSKVIFFLLLTFDFFLLRPSSFAQQPKTGDEQLVVSGVEPSRTTDSLQKVLLTATEDTNKVNTQNKLCAQFIKTSDYEKAAKIAGDALSLSEKLNFKNGIGDAYNNLGVINYNLGNYPEALKNYFASLKIREETGDKQRIAYSYNNIGVIYDIQGNNEEALKNYFASLKIREEIGDKQGIAYSYANIGVINDNRENYAEALKNYSAALKILKELGDKQAIANVYIDIGNVYLQQNNYPEGMVNLLAALEIQKELRDKKGIAHCYMNLAVVNIFRKNFKEARKYLDDALSISKEIGSKDFLKSIYNNLAEVESNLGNYKQSLEYYQLSIAYKDSLVNQESSEKIAQMQMKYEEDKKEEIRKLEQEKKDALAKQEKELTDLKQFWTEIICGIIFLSLSAIAFILYKRYKAKQKVNEIISEQKKMVEEKNKEITDSINYAQRIQKALLASDSILKQNLKEHFVFFKPKDIVSGDFYWATKTVGSRQLANGKEEKTERFYLAVCDSTGHGVPGAFMSLLNISFLNEAITEKGIVYPNEIFNHVRKRLIENISADGAQDGMDGILVCFEYPSPLLSERSRTQGEAGVRVTYSSANNPPVLMNGTLHELPSDKMPVGAGERKDSFTLHTIAPAPPEGGNTPTHGACLYLYSDGFPDQFGGPKGKKFKYKKLNEKLLSISHFPLETQKKELEKNFNEWKGNLEQVDDVLVIGIRV